jgi:hypothetical protein
MDIGPLDYSTSTQAGIEATHNLTIEGAPE